MKQMLTTFSVFSLVCTMILFTPLMPENASATGGYHVTYKQNGCSLSVTATGYSASGGLTCQASGASNTIDWYSIK